MNTLWIKKLTLSDGEELDLNDNDIVVIVGANNAGKTTFLKDITKLAYNPNNPAVKVITKLSFGFDEHVCRQIMIDAGEINPENGKYVFQTKEYGGYEIPKNELTSFNFLPTGNSIWPFYTAFIDIMTTKERLNITSPFSLPSGKNNCNSLQSFYFNRVQFNLVSNEFKKAFDIPLSLDTITEPKVEIRMCEGLLAKEGENYDEITERCKSNFKSSPMLDDQGDGMKSFAAVLIESFSASSSVYLIDEPETFLHPRQAFILGQAFASDLYKNKQLFIATHSSQLIKGLLESGSNRVRIVKIDRDQTTSFKVLPNDELKDAIHDPTFFHTNFLDGLFVKEVFVCESESDCRFYSALLDELYRKRSLPEDYLFLMTGGKEKALKLLSSFQKLDIQCKLILDFDALQDIGNLAKKDTAYFDLEFSTDFAQLNAMISKSNDSFPVPKVFIQKAFQDAINPLADSLEENDVEMVKKSLSLKSGWSKVKNKGLAFFKNTEFSDLVCSILRYLANKSIYLAKDGELEDWIPQYTRTGYGHGDKWVDTVFEKNPDLSSDIFAQVNSFLECVSGLTTPDSYYKIV